MKVVLLSSVFSIFSFSTWSDEVSDLKDQMKIIEQKLQKLEEDNEAIISAVEEGGGAADGWWTRTSLGGYGELHWENAHGSNDSNSAEKQVDAHRYVLFIGHEFNDYLNFVSEFELEHGIAGEGKNGEIELEQMYIEQNMAYMDWKNTFIKWGTFLVPVGILNETHEPPTFYGVERNVVEKELNANTWWESGILLQKGLPSDVDLTVAVHSSLSSTNGDIRAGRQKASEQDASSLAYTARLKYTGIAGVELGLWTNYHGDLDQTAGKGNVSATLWGAHINMSPAEGFGFRSVIGQWDLDCPTENSCATNGYAKQWGVYIEPSYRFSLGGAMDSSIGFFARAGARNDKADEAQNASNKVRQYDFGMNYWLAPNAVLKIDYENSKLYSSGKGTHGWNFGVGYQF